MGKVLTPLQRLFAALHGLNETGFFLEVARNNVLYQLLRICGPAGLPSASALPRLRVEVYFHCFGSSLWGTSTGCGREFLRASGARIAGTIGAGVAGSSICGACQIKFLVALRTVEKTRARAYSRPRKIATITRGLRRPWNTATTHNGFFSGAYAIKNSRTNLNRSGRDVRLGRR
jgi:hypothetical protein